MANFKSNDRVLITLVDKEGKVVEKRLVKMSMIKAASLFDIKSNLDHGDKIIVESEEL